FSDSRGARARNNQIRRRVLLMEIVEERPHVRVEPHGRVGRARSVQLGFTGLVGKAQSSLPIGKQGKAFKNGVVDGSSSLASSENKNLIRRLVFLVGNGFELRANRIA